MGRWWDDEKTLWLITPEEFERLPQGFELTCIDGTKAVIGTDYIDTDTRMGHLAYGASKEAIERALSEVTP